MRKTNFALALAAVFMLCSCNNGPKTIKGDNEGCFKLGTIKEADGPVEFIGTMGLDISEELTVTKVMTACSCTSAEIIEPVVAPGDLVKLKISYNPAYRKGDISEGLSVFFSNNTFINLYVKATVIPTLHPIEESCRYNFGHDLYMSHTVWPIGRLAAGESNSMYFNIGNNSKKPLKVEFTSDSPYAKYASFRDKVTLKADARDTLHVSFTMPEGFGQLDTLIVPFQPIVNGEPTEQTVYIRAYGKN